LTSLNLPADLFDRRLQRLRYVPLAADAARKFLEAATAQVGASAPPPPPVPPAS